MIPKWDTWELFEEERKRILIYLIKKMRKKFGEGVDRVGGGWRGSEN